MLSQQQAEREEQQRIKNLVLNYEIRENEEQEGRYLPLSSGPTLWVLTPFQSGMRSRQTFTIIRSKERTGAGNVCGNFSLATLNGMLLPGLTKNPYQGSFLASFPSLHQATVRDSI